MCMCSHQPSHPYTLHLLVHSNDDGRKHFKFMMPGIHIYGSRDNVNFALTQVTEKFGISYSLREIPACTNKPGGGEGIPYGCRHYFVYYTYNGVFDLLPGLQQQGGQEQREDELLLPADMFGNVDGDLFSGYLDQAALA